MKYKVLIIRNSQIIANDIFDNRASADSFILKNEAVQDEFKQKPNVNYYTLSC